MARTCIAEAVREALVAMGVEHVVVDYQRRHPRILWEDRGGELRGSVTVPGTSGDRRALLNNVRMAERLVRRAREKRRD